MQLSNTKKESVALFDKHDSRNIIESHQVYIHIHIGRAVLAHNELPLCHLLSSTVDQRSAVFGL